MTCERRRELNLHRREASCLQGDVITGYKYLQGNNGDRGSELFTGARWQDTEQARPGRGELAPRGPPELEPGRGPSGQPGPGHPTCREPAAPWQRCEGPGRTHHPRLHPSLALRSPKVPPGSSGHSGWLARVRPRHSSAPGCRDGCWEEVGAGAGVAPARQGVLGRPSIPHPGLGFARKDGDGDVPCPQREGHPTASPVSLGGVPRSC